jgi:ribosomal protein S24E
VNEKVVNIKIISVEDNVILHRTEITFEIEHLGMGSPNRIEVRDKLAALQSAKTELTFIKRMKSRFGSQTSAGLAIIYEDEETALKLEPKYSQIRNIPKDKRDDAWKEVKSKKKKKKK